jgi:superfamily I DNA/RNA helicase
VSLRQDGSLVIRRVDELAAAVVAELGATRSLAGSVGVIASDQHLNALRAALVVAGEQPGELDDPESSRITMVPATLAKGLEYDHVIVVEPADIVDAEPRGLHRLYVVLTRAVTRLTVVHVRPLPDALVVTGQG